METVLLSRAKRLLAFATKSDLGVLLPLQRQLDVRYWHKADMSVVLRQCPLSGVKRTSIGPASMSANDPKRTSDAIFCYDAQRGAARP
jgi:hypothetical protein